MRLLVYWNKEWGRVKAVIMAGGKGTRLKPLTVNLPKPMVPVLNKPVMEYAVELLKKHNITDIAVTLQYLPEIIKDYFSDGTKFGVNLKYFEEAVPLGTAGSVKNAEDFLDDTFIVISGDGITDYNLAEAVEFHRRKGGIATLVMAKVANPLEYGIIMCNEENRIIRFLEKPSWGEVFSDTVNTGIYILEPEIFNYFNKDAFFDFSKDLFPLLLREGIPMHGYVVSGYWSDIGSLEQYRQTHCDILDGLIDVDIKGHKIEDGLWIGRNTVLEPDVEIKEKPVFIGDNCKLGAQVNIGKYTVLGNNNEVGGMAKIEHSTLWQGNILGGGTKLNGVTIGSNTVIKSEAVLNEGCVVGDRSVVGERVVVKSDVKIWPNKIVVDDSTLYSSLIWNKSNRRVLFSEHGIIGAANTEITPEMAAKLGVAFGSIISAGESVIVGYDSNRSSQVLGKACAAGLSAAGLNVYDVGVSNSAAVRYGVKSLRVQGGMHIRMLRLKEPPQFALEFSDKDGIYINKDLERKIENAYLQGDLRRINLDDFGEIRYIPRVADAYRDALLQTINRENLRRRRFKITIAYDFLNLNWLIEPLLNAAGCEINTIKHADCREADLFDFVKSNQSDFGVILNSNADKITFVSVNGEKVSGNRLLALWAYVSIDQVIGRKVAIPVTAPSIIEKIVEQRGGEIVRTKACPRAMMEVNKEARFQPLFDGVYILLKVLEYLENKSTDLTSILKEIPPAFMAEKRVECPFLRKGAVMRRVIEDERQSKIELLEGIKIYRDNGWVLLTPDPEDQAFTVLCDAEASETAEFLVDFYARKVDYFKTGI